MKSWTDLEQQIGAVTGEPFRIDRRAGASGGCINTAWTIEGCGARYFVKLNAPHRAAMFEAEAAGLQALNDTKTIRVPQPVCHGIAADASWIVLEHVELRARTRACDAALGQRLAALHRHTSAHYGWHRDNTIGTTAQSNAQYSDWCAFWRERRLDFQLRRARENGHEGKLLRDGAKLLDRIEDFFVGYTPPPSLVHGDLWSGNASCDADGEPVVYDPAVYYGDREADIAMTELFGGFSASFYGAYRDAYPLDPGYATRKTLYNLYHVLNHLNLFGGGYRAQAERMIGGLLAA
jgi:fructosamine-3-kinase